MSCEMLSLLTIVTWLPLATTMLLGLTVLLLMVMVLVLTGLVGVGVGVGEAVVLLPPPQPKAAARVVTTAPASAKATHPGRPITGLRLIFAIIVRLAYIICEPCVGTKDSACVDVCPVDCIHPRKDEPGFAAAEMLYIHLDECIDCGACVPACPVEAIFSLDETPHKWSGFIGKNRGYYE